MSAPGRFKLVSRNRGYDAYLSPAVQSARRVDRILASLRKEIVEGGSGCLRIRRVFDAPRAIYRLEIALPDYGYLRTTLLDQDALEELLATDDVREVVHAADLSG